MADNMTAGKKLIDPAPVISKLADRALLAKGRECSLLGEVIDLLMAAEDVADIYVGYKWVPTAERLPEEDRRVLVACRTKKGVQSVNLAYFWNGCWHGQGSMAGVTHWMPLPDAPEVK